MQEPAITPELIENHGLKPDEYQMILQIIGREPTFTELGIFSATQFLDYNSASLQLEYRHRFTKRLGAVAFAGVGQVGPQFKDLDIGGNHSAVGVGGRYRVSKKFPVDFSVDVSRNSQRENTLYIYVGQRF